MCTSGKRSCSVSAMMRHTSMALMVPLKESGTIRKFLYNAGILSTRSKTGPAHVRVTPREHTDGVGF